MPCYVKNKCLQALVDMLVIALPDAKKCPEYKALFQMSLPCSMVMLLKLACHFSLLTWPSCLTKVPPGLHVLSTKGNFQSLCRIPGDLHRFCLPSSPLVTGCGPTRWCKVEQLDWAEGSRPQRSEKPHVSRAMSGLGRACWAISSTEQAHIYATVSLFVLMTQIISTIDEFHIRIRASP